MRLAKNNHPSDIRHDLTIVYNWSDPWAIRYTGRMTESNAFVMTSGTIISTFFMADNDHYIKCLSPESNNYYIRLCKKHRRNPECYRHQYPWKVKSSLYPSQLSQYNKSECTLPECSRNNPRHDSADGGVSFSNRV